MAGAVSILLMGVACSGNEPADRETIPSETAADRSVAGRPDLRCEWASVVRVVDGDTLDVDLEGAGEDTVRLIGVNAPETHHPTRGAEPYGEEAAAFMESFLGGRDVCLERDLTERDDFNRLLRYVWMADGRMANAEILAAGFARVETYPPDVKYVESHYLPAVQSARIQRIGIWNDVPVEGCSTSYPSVCIPDPPPDLDCGDVEYRRFLVKPPDPHHFDADGNGVACES